MNNIEALIEQGLELETEGNEAAAIAYFQRLVAQYPDDARVQFETGGAYDFAGQEAEAIPHYRRAIELGLLEDDLPKVAVQLGSSLRNVGKYDEAVKVLAEACKRFPEHRALRAFLALAQVSAGEEKTAVAGLLDLLLTNPGAVEAYSRSLRYYADELKAGGND